MLCLWMSKKIKTHIQYKFMERHSCLIRLLGMMIFQVRLYATELPLYLVRFTSVIIVSYIVTRFWYPIIILKVQPL